MSDTNGNRLMEITEVQHIADAVSDVYMELDTAEINIATANEALLNDWVGSSADAFLKAAGSFEMFFLVIENVVGQVAVELKNDKMESMNVDAFYEVEFATLEVE